MSMNKKILAVAIVGGLFATSANAAVVISSPVPVAVSVASELNFTAGKLAVTNAASVLDLTTSLNYAFSAGEVRYARIECNEGMEFTSGTVTAAGTGSGAPPSGAAIGAINGVGTSAINFSITAGTTPPVAATTLTVDGNRTFSSTNAVTCTYGLYDQPSQAASGGATGRIATASGAYANFKTSYLYNVTGNTSTASVEATPSYSRFVITGNPTGLDSIAQLAQVKFDTRANTTSPAETQPIKADGTTVTLGNILAAGSKHVVTGDFSAAADVGGLFGTLSRVYISGLADCSTNVTSATAITATSATFTTGAAPINGWLCYAPRSSLVIPASEYKLAFAPVSMAGYTAGALGPVAAGEIVRNGTELQAPLVQLPGNGWLSRMVLTNTGSSPRAYTVAVLRETGSAGTTGALTGNVPANGTIVVDINSILPSFSAGLPRATLNVTIAGPTKQIQGLYQIVNANSLTISNHVMVRPGTN